MRLAIPYLYHMKKWSSFALLVMALIACSEQEKPTTETVVQEQPKHQVINGVERSELALTMRYMYDQLVLTRDSLKEGIEVSRKIAQRIATIHTDTPTEPEKIDETYHAMADLFLNAYKNFEADTSGQIETYNAMIETCVACHQQKCPGPVKAITKLKVKG